MRDRKGPQRELGLCPPEWVAWQGWGGSVPGAASAFPSADSLWSGQPAGTSGLGLLPLGYFPAWLLSDTLGHGRGGERRATPGEGPPPAHCGVSGLPLTARR